MRVHTDWLLTPQRAAVHIPSATAVVADLHLGYSEARRRGGDAVPVPRIADVLAPLARVGARRLVVAGDLFEAGACDALVGGLLDWLREVGLELEAVAPGNHDRGIQQYAGRLPICPDGVTVGGWRVLHGDGQLPHGPLVHGHFHPCLRWGKGHSAPCYLVGADRLVLPAFSSDAAGVGVCGDPRWRTYRCCVPARNEVLDFGELTATIGPPGGRRSTTPLTGSAASHERSDRSR